MRSILVLPCAILAACTSTPNPPPTVMPSTQAPQAQESKPQLSLLDVRLTCDRLNERSADGQVRGQLVGADAATAYHVAVVQGTDAFLGDAALPAADTAGAAFFVVAVTKVQTEQPVRVVLREAGARSVSELVEVAPDAATCSRR